MSPAPRRWRLVLVQDAAEVLAAMGAGGPAGLHRQVTLFLRALAVEAGAAADADKPLPGLPMDDGRHNVDVPGLPVLLSYLPHPASRQIRVTDLIWLD